MLTETTIAEYEKHTGGDLCRSCHEGIPECSSRKLARVAAPGICSPSQREKRGQEHRGSLSDGPFRAPPVPGKGGGPCLFLAGGPPGLVRIMAMALERICTSSQTPPARKTSRREPLPRGQRKTPAGENPPGLFESGLSGEGGVPAPHSREPRGRRFRCCSPFQSRCCLVPDWAFQRNRIRGSGRFPCL